MINEILLYIGSALIIVWGIAHLFPTKSIVNGFGEISKDNKLIITMEWIAEGISFIFIGILVLLVTKFGVESELVPRLVYWISSGALIGMAVLSIFTGARLPVI
ncbi:MAG: hypothetical protein ACTSQF_09480, partial [Candidatus Heimdallarchaeaceae archaeon]